MYHAEVLLQLAFLNTFDNEWDAMALLMVAVTLTSTSPFLGDRIARVPSSTGFPIAFTRTALCVLVILI